MKNAENKSKWMNMGFFNKILLKNFPDTEVNLISFEVVSSADEKSYNGGTHRVCITYSKAKDNGAESVGNTKIIEQRLFIKTVSETEFVAKFLTSMNVYAKEIEFYSSTMPKLDALIKTLDPSSSLFPKLVYVCEINSVIVLEDVTTGGYQQPSIHPGMNLIEAQAVLRKLAVFHAASAVLQEREPDIFANFKHGLINRSGHDTMMIHTTQLNAVIDFLSMWSLFDRYRIKLCNFRSHFEEKFRKAYEPSTGRHQFNALNHGDLWTANVMFKRVNNEYDLNDMKLIDFQFSCWTSPVVDLHMFLNTALEYDIHIEKITDLVEYYHPHLIEALNNLGYGKHIPTLEELMDDFKEKSVCGFAFSCLVTPEFHVDHPDEDVEIYLTDTEHAKQFKRSILDASDAQRIIRFFIPYYDQLGVFD